MGSVAWGKQSRGRRRNGASASGVGSLIMRQVRAQLFAYLVLGLHNVVLHAQAEVHAQVARRLARGERTLLDRHEIFAPVGRVGRTFRGNKGRGDGLFGRDDVRTEALLVEGVARGDVRSCIQSFLDSSAATRGAALGGNKSTFP